MPFSTGMERILTLQNAKKGRFPERFQRELPVEVINNGWQLVVEVLL